MNGRVPAVTGVVLGGSASVAANLAHAVYVQPHLSPVTVIGAVLWPLFTLIGFEVVVRPPWPTRGWRSLPWWLCRLAVIGVGVVAVVTSYEHMSGLLAYSGDNGFAVRYGPLAIDGLMVTSAAALLAIERFGRTAQATTPARVVQQSAPGPVPAVSTVLHLADDVHRAAAAGQRPPAISLPVPEEASPPPAPADPDGPPPGTVAEEEPRTTRPRGATGRNRELAHQMRAGEPDISNREIARRLGITPQTVGGYFKTDQPIPA